MRKRGIELSARHQFWLYLVFTVLFGSGAAWMFVHYCLPADSPMTGAPHPSEPLWMKLHGTAAMAALIVLGSVIPMHIRHAWILKKNRLSGALFIGVMAILTLTGYGLYYAGGENLRWLLSQSHSWIGLAFPLILAAHVWFGRRSREP